MRALPADYSALSVADRALAGYGEVVVEFGIPAPVAGSHRARETDAVVTADGVIEDAGVAPVWR